MLTHLFKTAPNGKDKQVSKHPSLGVFPYLELKKPVTSLGNFSELCFYKK